MFEVSLPVLLSLAAQGAITPPSASDAEGAPRPVRPPTPPPPPGGAGARGSGPGRASAGHRGGPAPIPVPPPGGRTQAVDPFSGTPKADMSPSTDLSRTWGYSKSKRPPKPLFADDPSSSEVPPNPIGFYSGVRVAAPEFTPPWAPPDPAKAPPTLTWPGFERGPRSSRVFFQVTRPVTYELSREDGRLLLRMSGTRVDVRNNTRPLDLRYHRTPVRTVRVRREGDDAVAVLSLRAPAEPRIRTATAENGYFMVILEFPDPTPQGGVP